MTSESAFNKLTFEQREVLCITEGRCVNVIYEDDKQFMLFAVDGLFIEVVYSPENGKLLEIKLLDPPERLTHYIGNIDISDAIQ